METPIVVVGGTGDAGFGLALRWAKAGYDVVIGSRDAARAQTAANEINAQVPGERARGLRNPEAVASSTLVVLAVPFSAQSATIKDIAESIQPGTLVVDITVPLATAIGGRVTQTLGVWEGSAAQRTAALLAGKADVVAAFQNVAADSLKNLDLEIDEDILVAGPKAGKERMRDLVTALPGARLVDAGTLEMARHLEGITALLAGINGRYKTRGAGIRITGLPEQG
jgi:NADPH-dependent F420 reductase